HFLDRHLVDLRFGFAETAEDGDGIAPGAFGDIGLFDQLHDVREVAVNVLLLHLHVVFGGADAAALDLLERNRGTALERGDGVGDGDVVGAGVGQGADQHVAADSRKCVQIASKWHLSNVGTRRGPGARGRLPSLAGPGAGGRGEPHSARGAGGQGPGRGTRFGAGFAGSWGARQVTDSGSGGRERGCGRPWRRWTRAVAGKVAARSQFASGALMANGLRPGPEVEWRGQLGPDRAERGGAADLPALPRSGYRLEEAEGRGFAGGSRGTRWRGGRSARWNRCGAGGD